ncbi:flavodoxin family protein [Oceanirhabdus sp. W0125-5]|uniref:flavodoxin family protein n=1 Tax=Oceanirhabdus sp. W0125-5 TaxID=2999116 RepID=UPI0022F3263A|nr:flavodoxin family protein [Oceanirhabdus sp. W0125-5]WBW95594.1 flavodoxin family protein [Oceanirhabdus sp. W0125-5]
MKTLIINGSPRKNGDTMALINEMRKYLKGEVEVIDAYYANISPCIDCRYCWNNDGCTINDEMQGVYKLLNEVDNVILASPIYFSQLTGKVLSFASRLQCFFVARCIKKDINFQLKKKMGALIITGGGDGNPELGIRGANIIFKQMNTESIGTVQSLHTNNIAAKEDKQALKNVRELALRLNELKTKE